MNEWIESLIRCYEKKAEEHRELVGVYMSSDEYEDEKNSYANARISETYENVIADLTWILKMENKKDKVIDKNTVE